MSRLSRIEDGGLTSQILKAVPGASVLVFDVDLRVVLVEGHVPLADLLDDPVGEPIARVLASAQWSACEPLVRAALAGWPDSVQLDGAQDDIAYVVDVAPLWNSTGAVVGGVCCWRNISEQNRLASEIEQRARLMDLAHDAIIVREPIRDTVVYWNQQATEIYGYSADEAIGRITHELLETEFPESLQAVDEALNAAGRWEGELVHSHRGGRRIPVASRQALARDERGRPVAIIELNADITEHKRVVQELRAAEQRFRGLIEAAAEAMVIVDEQGMIVLVNQRAEELLGYTRDELLGTGVDRLLPADLRSRHVIHRAAYNADPRARAMGMGLDLRVRRKDASEFAAEISLSPLHTDTGLLVSVSIRDISRQLLRQLEQALVPRMRISDHWQVAWRYLPSVRTMLLAGDFIGVLERRGGALSLLIGDVTGHGPSAAGTGAMLRAAWLGAAQAEVPIESMPELLHRLLVRQADHRVGQLATICLAEIEPNAREARFIRAGHDSPLLISSTGVSEVAGRHGPALGLAEASDWPLEHVRLPDQSAIMMFTDGVTERRGIPGSPPLGFDDLLPELDAEVLLTEPPAEAIDVTLASLFPDGTDALTDDLAMIVVKLTDQEQKE